MHGIRTPDSGQCVCCPGYKGELCDKHDCGCGGSLECSGHGECIPGVDEQSNKCQCTGKWIGKCCEIDREYHVHTHTHNFHGRQKQIGIGTAKYVYVFVKRKYTAIFH